VKLRAPILIAIAAAAGLLLASAAIPQIPSGREVVSPAIYVSREPVARGGEFQVAVVMKIRPGFHVNAREKSEDYLIATDLRAEVPAGFKAGDVVYPKGALHSFAFSKTPLNVYQDAVTLRIPLTALAGASLGPQHIPLKLRYQACSNEICLPPVTLDLYASFKVVASASDSRPAHPEIFRDVTSQGPIHKRNSR
jgi:Thiol:disulfide interchange protein DsbD, N-terminal